MRRKEENNECVGDIKSFISPKRRRDGSDKVGFFKNKVIRGIALVVGVTIVLLIASGVKNNVITNSLNTFSTPAQHLFAKILRPITEHFNVKDRMDAYRTENKELIKEVARLKIKMRDSESYIAENERLKALLDLKDRQVNMTTVAAQVVAKDYDYRHKGIKINRGTKDGICEGDPVMTSDGILGVVESVGVNWAVITTVFDGKSAVGARFTRTGDVGVVEGSQELGEYGKCKIEYISATASVMNGDILVTSGLGEVYPSGLMIGKVSEVKVDAMGNVEYALVDPAVSFDEVYEVLVITDFEEEEPAEIKDDKKEDEIKEDEDISESGDDGETEVENEEN